MNTELTVNNKVPSRNSSEHRLLHTWQYGVGLLAQTAKSSFSK
ncbi:MAG: hypothetical protein WBM86_19235 [Waterburya sp.]